MKKAMLFLSVLCASGLTMVTIYNTIVDAFEPGRGLSPPPDVLVQTLNSGAIGQTVAAWGFSSSN